MKVLKNVLHVFLLILLFVIVLILVFKNSKQNFINTENDTEENKAVVARTQRVMKDNSVNIYTRSFLELFVNSDIDDFSEQSTILTFDNGVKVCLLVNFHYLNLDKVFDNLAPNVFKVMLDGEPNPLDKLLPKLDCTITTKQNIPNTTFLMEGIGYLKRFNKDHQQLTLPRVYTKRNKFAVFAYSNCNDFYEGVLARKTFYYLIQKMTNYAVTNLGSCYKDIIKENYYEKNDTMFTTFKFVIAFENQCIPGYISEKFINAILSGSIPVYRGAADIGKYFNTKAFINVNDFDSYEEVVNYMIEISNNEELFKKIINEPILANDFDYNQFSFLTGGKFYQDLFNNVPQKIGNILRPYLITSNKINFITFGYDSQSNTDRIVFQADDSKYFTNVIPYSQQTMPNQLLTTHRTFILNNKENFGCGIWKPYIILDALSKSNLNDVIVFCDSRSTIYPCKSLKMIEYYNNILLNDITVFPVKYTNLSYCKADTLHILLNQYEAQSNVDVISRKTQFSSEVVIIKNTQNSINFLNEWIQNSSIYNLLDNSNSKNNTECQFFNKHLNDQSIFSLLIEIYLIKNILKVGKIYDLDVNNQNDIVIQPRNLRT